jgi:CHAT domain-containing protein/Flp pilus assembly protein TadD
MSKVTILLLVFSLVLSPIAVSAQSAQELYEKGKAAVSAGNMVEGTAAYEQAIVLVRKNEPRSELHARISEALGNCYWQARANDKALSLFEESLNITAERKGVLDIGFGAKATTIAELYGAEKNPERAVFYLKEALPAYVKEYGLSHRALLPIRFSIATASDQLGDYDTSAKYYKEILRYSTLADSDKVFVMGGLAGAYQQLEELDSAIGMFGQRLAIEERLYTRRDTRVVHTLNDLGAAYIEAGRFGKAEECYLEAYNTGKAILKSGDPTIALMLDRLAYINMQRKRYEQAIDFYKSSLRLKESLYGKGAPDYLQALSSVAASFSAMGKPAEALPLQESVYSIKKKTLQPDHPEMINATLDIANSLYKLGRLKDSEAVCHEVLAVKPRSIPAVMLLADIYQQQGRVKEEEVARIKAMQLARPGPSREYGKTVMHLAQYYQRQKDTGNATNYFLQAIDLTLRDLSNNFAYQTEHEKLLYLRDMLLDENNFVAMAFAQNQPAMTGKAYDFAASVKGIVMNSTVALRSLIMRGGTEEQKERYRHWESINANLAGQLARVIYGSGKSVIDTDQIRRSANRAEKKIIETIGQRTLKLPTKSWKEIAATLLQKEAMVEIFRTEAGGTGIHYFAVLIGHGMTDHPEVIEVPNGAELEKKYLAHYRDAVTGQIEDLVSYEQFWQPVQTRLTELGVTKVYFAPAGVYQQVNLNTLFNPSTRAFLVNELDISYITSGFDLLEPADQRQSKTAVLIGNPRFSNAGKSKGAGEFFDAIPGTQAEVDAVGNLLRKKGWKATLLTGAAATESSAKSLFVKAHVLHIAAPCFFIGDEYTKKLDSLAATTSEDDYVINSDPVLRQNDRMMRSGLAFTGASDFLNDQQVAFDIKHDDGLLTAFEVCGLSLENTQLVVLSACKTRIGDVDASDGVFGLQRAFKLAGSKNLVMSLWSGTEEATADFMTAFYLEWVATDNVSASFKSAQKKMIVKYQQPVYWGGFLIVGR